MKETILFVDDDPHVLASYKHTLQKTFAVDTASGGEDALKLLAESGPYAVVVADMEMPAMSGGKLLERVRERAPETIRMVLTAHTDIGTAMAAVNQGHVFRFLTKPCQLDVMLAALHAGIDEYRRTVTKRESIEVEPLYPRGAAPWAITLGADTLTLLNASGTPVIEMFREEAARYMRFDHALFRGMTINISVIPGLKAYSFICAREPLATLLAWLPHKAPEEIRKEIRFSGIAVGLLGILQLLLPEGPFWGWGILLLLTGILGIALPRRRVYFLNIPVMLLVGLADFIAPSPGGAHLATGWSAAPLWPVLAGGMLFLWTAHQISLSSVNQYLRTVRALRDKRAAFLPVQSPIIRWVGHAVRWVSLVFAAYTAAVVIAIFVSRDATGSPKPLTSMLPDLAIFGVLTVLLMAMATLISLRKRPAYAEAKVAAQLMIAVLVLAFWSVQLNFDPRDPLAFFGHVFGAGLFVYERPYEWGTMSFFGGLLSKQLAVYARPSVWITLVICILLFNYWFMRRVDNELEEQRGQILP
jgi:ActR/RegA family two-component response regulator